MSTDPRETADRSTPPIDGQLWVRLTNGETAYLLGNPHTWPGHFNVWRPAIDEVYTCSFREVAESSDEARYWLDGYLAASEPDPDEIWGDRVLDLDDDGPELTAWRHAAQLFRRTGEWAPTVLCVHCGALQLPREITGLCDRCGLAVEEGHRGDPITESGPS